MPSIICQSICNPSKEIGEMCGAKRSRRAGMFCSLCKDNAVRLLKPGSELPDEWRQLLELLGQAHLDANAQEKIIKNRSNHKRRSKDAGAMKQYVYTALVILVLLLQWTDYLILTILKYPRAARRCPISSLPVQCSLRLPRRQGHYLFDHLLTTQAL